MITLPAAAALIQKFLSEAMLPPSRDGGAEMSWQMGRLANILARWRPNLHFTKKGAL